MTPVDLSRTVLHAVRRAVREDALRAPVPARVRVERTRPGGRGEYASAVALQLAGPAGLGAREVAEILRDRLAGAPGVAGVEITGPGFLNFTLDASVGAAAHRDLVHRVREEGERYGHGDALAGQRPLLVHAREVRAAVTADAVRRLLAAQGAGVRVSCAGEPDPDWARLGVSAESREEAAVASIRPVPAGDTAAGLLTRLGPDAARWGLL
ncbi:arginine--tRNA ligase, partial [Streptomyces sp. SID9124]|nr:arginine--tRNA ligase [Streptomyces sp. SID9124]